MIYKYKPVRLRKIRESARDQECVVVSPECNGDPATTRLIHYRSHDDNAGIGIKPDDTSACYSCSSCDSWLGEGNKGSHASDDEGMRAYNVRQWYWCRAMRRTWRLLITEGVLR